MKDQHKKIKGYTVISSKSMVVYHAEKLEIEDVGAYEY